MMNEIDERIIRYYDHEMSETEVKDFLAVLEGNSEIKSQWEFYGNIIEGIKSEGGLELKEYIKEHVKTEEIEEQSNLWMYAAASVAFLLLSYFAIYSYLETGNIKEAAEIITLKDKKSDKFKFWKKDQSKYSLTIKDSARFYKDSLLALEIARMESDSSAKDEISSPEMSADVAMYENDGNLESAEITLEGKAVSSIARRDEFMVLTQVNVIPIKLSVPINANDKDVLESVQTMGIGTRLSKSRISPPQKEVGKAPAVSDAEVKITESKPITDSAAIKPKVKSKTNISRFKLQHYEDENGTAHIELKNGTAPAEVQLILFNIWGDNPLIFEIEGIYYLDLGQNGPWASKGGSGIWKIPENKGNYSKIEWVKNKTIIDQIRN